jgi:hypothetical protein
MEYGIWNSQKSVPSCPSYIKSLGPKTKIVILFGIFSVFVALSCQRARQMVVVVMHVVVMHVVLHVVIYVLHVVIYVVIFYKGRFAFAWHSEALRADLFDRTSL